MRRALMVCSFLTLIAVGCSDAAPSETTLAQVAPTTTPASLSYDLGWHFGSDELCSGFVELFDTPEGRDRVGLDTVETIVDRWNGYVIRTITDSVIGDSVDSLVFVSGMWDGATETCIEWFPNPDTAGRPGGGDVAATAAMSVTVEGLEPGSFVATVADLVSDNSGMADASYPRPPTSDELLAVMEYYEDRNAAAHSATALRRFWLEHSHPVLACTAEDMEDILLPEDGSESWLTSVRMVPDHDSLVMAEDDPDFGPMAVVQRINVETGDGQSREYGPTTDYLFIVDGVAYEHFECGPPPTASQSTASASDQTRSFYGRIHSSDIEGALEKTYRDLVAPIDDATARAEFIVAIRGDWADAVSGFTDAELLEQAESVCFELSEWGAGENFDAFHGPGSWSADASIEDLAMWGFTMYYWGGRTMCRDEYSRAEWEEWVRLELYAGFEQATIDSMLYGFDNVSAGKTGPEYLDGYAATWSDDEWTDWIIGMIDGVLAKPGVSPFDYGQLHAFGAARVLSEPHRS